jgi:L-lactate utilization protein LutB
MLFEVQPGANETSGKEPGGLPLLPPGAERGLDHLILDNGRTGLLAGKFHDLFLCIGCRACNQRCPIRHSFARAGHVWTPRNYLNQFMDGASKSIDGCLHCEGCRLVCPLEIDLPHLMWEAKLDYVVRHGVSFGHKILGRPELIARAGSMAAPLANAALRLRILRRAMEVVPGIHRDVRMPAFHRETFAAWFAGVQKKRR